VNKGLKISIITPNYNYCQFIPETIESIIKQNYVNVEHIIVDDGSTDKSVEIIKEYQRRFPGKIKLIQQANNGQSAALNVALGNVTGDVICWLNSDDSFCENIFKRIISELEEDHTLFAVFGDINIIDASSNYIKTNKYLKFKYISAVFNDFGKEIPSNGIFWRNTQESNRIKFNEEFEYAMDSEYWSRLLVNKKIKKTNIPVANFRWHENAKTIKSKIKENKGYYKVIKEREIIFKHSYKCTKISHYIPIKYSILLFFFFRLRRLLLRGIKGAYFYNNRL